MLVNNQQITEEIKKEVKIWLETNDKKKHDNWEPMGHTNSGAKREIYSNTSPLQNTRETSSKQPNLTPKATSKRRTTPTTPKLVEGEKL